MPTSPRASLTAGSNAAANERGRAPERRARSARARRRAASRGRAAGATRRERARARIARAPSGSCSRSGSTSMPRGRARCAPSASTGTAVARRAPRRASRSRRALGRSSPSWPPSDSRGAATRSSLALALRALDRLASSMRPPPAGRPAADRSPLAARAGGRRQQAPAHRDHALDLRRGNAHRLARQQPRAVVAARPARSRARARPSAVETVGRRAPTSWPSIRCESVIGTATPPGAIRPPALGEMPEEREQPAVDAVELRDRLRDREALRALVHAVDDRRADLRVAAELGAQTRGRAARTGCARARSSGS